MSRVAFLFPGQGAQAVGMGQQLAETLPAARALMDRAGEILGYDLAKLCYEGPADELNDTVHSQPALYVTSLMALEQCKQDKPELVESVEAIAGLSLGEYTALAFADAISFEDGLRVVQRRGEAMQAAADATSSGMVSILGLEREQVEQLPARFIQRSCSRRSSGCRRRSPRSKSSSLESRSSAMSTSSPTAIQMRFASYLPNRSSAP